LRSGTIDEIGSVITWKCIYQGNETYTIQPKNFFNMYLDHSGSYVSTKSDSTIWICSTFTGIGGIKWIARGDDYEYVLGVDDNGNVVIDEESNFTAQQKAWRMVEADSYKELTNIDAYIDSELYDHSNEMHGRTIEFQQTADIRIHPENKDTFINAEDFEYSLDPSHDTITVAHVIISVTGKTVSLEGKLYGYNQLKIKHIPTGTEAWVRINVKGCAGEMQHEYADHVYDEVETDCVRCVRCGFTISLNDYNLYVYDGPAEEMIFPTYETYSTKDEAVLAKAPSMFQYTMTNNQECIAGIYKTIDGRYIVSNYKTSFSSSSITIFDEYRGIPATATLIGFVHTHPLTSTEERFSIVDIQNAFTHIEKGFAVQKEEEVIYDSNGWEIQVQLIEDYLIHPTSSNTYEVWKLDVTAQTPGEAYDNQIQVYPEEEDEENEN